MENICIRDPGSATLKGRVAKTCVFQLLRHAAVSQTLSKSYTFMYSENNLYVIFCCENKLFRENILPSLHLFFNAK